MERVAVRDRVYPLREAAAAGRRADPAHLTDQEPHLVLGERRQRDHARVSVGAEGPREPRRRGIPLELAQRQRRHDRDW